MLELVIALAMMAVLAAYAIPSYVGYLARGHRVDAVMALYRAAQFVAAGALADGAVPVLPSGLDRAPAHGRAVYRLETRPASERNVGYEIWAIPVADGPMRDDACGTFVLDALGMRGNRDRAASTESAGSDTCWLGRSA